MNSIPNYQPQLKSTVKVLKSKKPIIVGGIATLGLLGASPFLFRNLKRGGKKK